MQSRFLHFFCIIWLLIPRVLWVWFAFVWFCFVLFSLFSLKGIKRQHSWEVTKGYVMAYMEVIVIHYRRRGLGVGWGLIWKLVLLQMSSIFLCKRCQENRKSVRKTVFRVVCTDSVASSQFDITAELLAFCFTFIVISILYCSDFKILIFLQCKKAAYMDIL